MTSDIVQKNQMYADLVVAQNCVLCHIKGFFLQSSNFLSKFKNIVVKETSIERRICNGLLVSIEAHRNV